MGVRPSILWIFAISILFTSFALTFWIRDNPPEREPTTKSESTQPSKMRRKSVTVLPAGFDWDKTDKEEFASILDHLSSQEETAGHVVFELDEVVEPGSQIIADSIDGENGEFVFTTLTPNFETWPDGGKGVTVRVDCYSVALDGATRDVFRSEDPAAPERFVP